MSPILDVEKRKLYQKERYHRQKREAEEKREAWDQPVFNGTINEPSETEASDFEGMTGPEYDRAVGKFFDVIQNPQPEPEKIREIPEDKPLPEYERPQHLQNLTGEALESIGQGISSLLFDRVEKMLEKDDKNEKSGPWGQIVG
ncbi:unnamed protein product [marine sediment metagenome]|uniref:Uncharacterized protein n=1 Tax=marine sediment metagenome TaxID=412755 RepID=X1J3E1_9ZZZZ